MGKYRDYNDEKLLKMLQSSHDRKSAIAFLHEAHKHSIFKYVLNSGGTREEAEEISISALIATIRSVDAGRFEGRSRLSTYYVGTGKNLWRSELREKQRESYLQLEDVSISVFPDFQEEMDRRNRLARLRTCLEQLDETCRELIKWWKLSDPPAGWPEITEQLEFSSVQVAKNKGQRCMKHLRDCMEKAA